MRFAIRYRWSLLALILALSFLVQVRAANSTAGQPLLSQDSPLKAIRYTFPDSSWPGTLPPLCALARDLPLLNASGANTILTQGSPPDDGDHIFLSLLASTQLSWVASFPLSDEIDLARPLLDQRDAILARFTAFATRFGANPNLRAIVLDFGVEHAVESALLAPELAAVLAGYHARPESAANPEEQNGAGHRIRLGLAAYSSESLYYAPEGVDFWLYRFTAGSSSGADRQLLASRTPLPIVFDLSDVASDFQGSASGVWSDFLTRFTAGAPDTHLVPIHLIGSRETVPSAAAASATDGALVTSVIRYREDALFRGRRDSAGFENIEPTPFETALNMLWRGAPLEDYPGAPHLNEILNAATGTAYLSSGTRITLRGELLGLDWSAPPDSEWPLHAGASCLCVGNRPVAMGSLAPSEISAQLPWLLPAGFASTRFVRQGVASASHNLEILDASPGIFPLAVSRADSACSITDSGGVRPGDTLELEVTGVGPLNGGTAGLSVLMNGTPAEILDAALSAQAQGVATLHVRVPARAAQNGHEGLFLRQGVRTSNIVPLDFAGDGRPTVTLAAERSRILLQPGGLSIPLRIETHGVNGYCGSVEFSAEGLPKGITALIGNVEAGKPAALQLKADTFVETIGGRPFYLYGLPTPGDLAMLALEVRVMPLTGEMEVALESRGYPAGASAAITWNGELLPPTGNKAPRGLYLQIIDPRAGVFLPLEHYDLWESEDESARLEARLKTLRAGVIVGMAVADEATLHMQPSLRDWIRENLASAEIATLGYQHSWAILSKIGASAPLAESASANGPAIAGAVLVLPEK